MLIKKGISAAKLTLGTEKIHIIKNITTDDMAGSKRLKCFSFIFVIVSERTG